MMALLLLMYNSIQASGKRFGGFVTNKIKNFMWRACKDPIPTKVNLRRRSIPIPMLCDQCSVKEESG